VRTAGATALKEDVDGVPQLQYVPSTSVVVPISRKLTLTDLTERTCKWPVGDPLKDDFHFCGVDASDASPYCGYHAKLAYQPVAERRRAAAARA
ncbi:MAG: GcrA family cell cycle regulator, partial [Pseudorhizobium sp.]